MNRKLETVSSL